MQKSNKLKVGVGSKVKSNLLLLVLYVHTQTLPESSEEGSEYLSLTNGVPHSALSPSHRY